MKPVNKPSPLSRVVDALYSGLGKESNGVREAPMVTRKDKSTHVHSGKSLSNKP